MDVSITGLKRETVYQGKYQYQRVSYGYERAGSKASQVTREVFHRGHGASVLMYNLEKKTVLLIKQFRIPTYLEGNPSGILLEACAGSIDNEPPEACIRREALEETGYELQEVSQVFAAYMSPGAMTEIIYGFVAPYDATMKKAKGGGLASENEDIEVVELSFNDAWQLVKQQQIQDAKTIMLLQHAALHIFK